MVYENGTSPRYTLYIATQKKGEVELDLIIENETDLNVLSDGKIDLKGQPVVLSLFGDGIVQRFFVGNVDNLNIVIPNVNPKDYFMASCEYETNNTFLALLRLSVLEKIIESLDGQNVLIGSISLGFTEIIRYKQALSINDDYIWIGNQYLKYSEGEEPETGKEKTENRIEHLEAHRFGTRNAALSSAVSFFLNVGGLADDAPACFSENLKEIVAAKISSLLIKYLLPGLMVLLLINFLLFDSFQKKAEQLSGSVSNSVKLQKQLEFLKMQVEDEKEFYTQTNLHKNKHFAFYADRIASLSIPGIRFNKLTVNPLLKRVRSSEMINYKKNEIELNGFADDAECFSRFLMNIDTASFNLEIEKQAYYYDKKERKASFELVLKFQDE